MKIGNRKMQDAYIALSVSQGEVKSDPVVGANLARMIRGGANMEKIRKTIEISLESVGIRFEDIKNQLDLLINNNKVD